MSRIFSTQTPLSLGNKQYRFDFPTELIENCNKKRENRHAQDFSGTWVFIEHLLLLHFLPSFDPNGVTESNTCTAMEIAAMTGNASSFNLLAPHCKDELKKNLARMVLLALRDKDPCDEFKTLIASIPLAEVTRIELFQNVI